MLVEGFVSQGRALIQTGQTQRAQEELAKVEKINSTQRQRDADLLGGAMDPAQK